MSHGMEVDSDDGGQISNIKLSLVFATISFS